jgi:hypothetical protein
MTNSHAVSAIRLKRAEIKRRPPASFKSFNPFSYFLVRWIGNLRPEDWTAYATVAIALFTATLFLVTNRQVRLARDALDLAREEFISSHRPRLRIRNVIVNDVQVNITAPGQQATQRDRRPPFQPNNQITGQLSVANIGDTEARVVTSHCEVFWTDKPLPMRRPYEFKADNVFVPDGIKIAAGHSIPGSFNSTKLMTEIGHAIALGRDTWKIYVMGWILSIDKRKISRRTAFCREYRHIDGGRGRFYPIEDQDYEHEE